MPDLTRNQICALDGPALTELAHRLGLAPADVMTVWDMETDEFRGCWIHNDQGEPFRPWEPSTDIHAASDTFRSLRTRGWYTRVAGCTRGEAYAEKRLAPLDYLRECVEWPRAAPTKAHALLLVSVLAVVSEEEGSLWAPPIVRPITAP